MLLPDPDPGESRADFIARTVGAARFHWKVANDLTEHAGLVWDRCNASGPFRAHSHVMSVAELVTIEDRAAALPDVSSVAEATLYSSIIAYVANTAWAIRPDTLDTIIAMLRFRAAGNRLTPAEIRVRLGATEHPVRPGVARTGNIVSVPLHGIISHRAAMMGEMSSGAGTSVEKFRARFRAALADRAVSAIVVDIDSQGGTVDGVPELADEIFRARGGKPIVAIANTMAASAAYWIGSMADELVATPSAQVGSIGVYAAHTERSVADERDGIKTTLIAAGEFKNEGNPFEPLTAEAEQHMRDLVDHFYDLFVADVARGRAVKAASVRQGFGRGTMVNAEAAKAEGMIDRVETLDQLVGRLRGTAGRRGRASATHAGDMEFI